MKKINITLVVLCFAGVEAFSQSPIGGDAQKMSYAEANKNGVADPIINGKPYSQYKAEQAALKLQAANRKQHSGSNSGMINVAPQQNKPAPVNKSNSPEEGVNKPVESKMIADAGKTETSVTNTSSQVSFASTGELKMPTVRKEEPKTLMNTVSSTPNKVVEAPAKSAMTLDATEMKNTSQPKVQPVVANAGKETVPALPAGVKATLVTGAATQESKTTEPKTDSGNSDSQAKTKSN